MAVKGHYNIHTKNNLLFYLATFWNLLWVLKSLFEVYIMIVDQAYINHDKKQVKGTWVNSIQFSWLLINYKICQNHLSKIKQHKSSYKTNSNSLLAKSVSLFELLNSNKLLVLFILHSQPVIVLRRAFK